LAIQEQGINHQISVAYVIDKIGEAKFKNHLWLAAVGAGVKTKDFLRKYSSMICPYYYD